MGRANYGRVGGRRSGGAAWQWILIGLLLGLGCSAIFVLSLLTFGVLNLEGTSTEVAIQNTQPPPPTVDVAATANVIVQATLNAIPTQTEPPPPTATEPQVMIVPSATSLPTDTPEGEAPSTEEVVPEAQEDNTQPPSTDTTTEGEVPDVLALGATDLVRIDAGSFMMGTDAQEVAIAVRECEERDAGNCQIEWGIDSTPLHQVTLNAFMMEEHEVTNEQYVAFLNWMGPTSHLNGCDGRQCIETSDNLEGSVISFDSQNYFVNPDIFRQQPVVAVTWYGAKAYCEALGRRLPTEAEWEYAARGTEGRLYPWGNDWITENARTSRCSADPTGATPGSCIGALDVQSIPTNLSPFGVSDMAGNIAEWVSDWYGANYYSQTAASDLNPIGPASGVDKSIRGGSWDTVPFFARTVHRQHTRPENAFLWLGFRCADEFEEPTILPADNDAGLGTLPTIDPNVDAAPTEPVIDAAPTLAPLATGTTAPAVPPGG